ncbi:MAG: TraB/GumN family protein [archaeon]
MSLEAVNIGKKEYLLVGTAHVSKQSVQDVKKIIDEEKPDVVAVELCERRYETLRDKDKWRDTELSTIIKEGRAHLFLANLILSNFQRKIGEKLGVEPGAEMLAAIESTEKIGSKVELIDRDIQVTMKRALSAMGFFEKLKLMGTLIFETFSAEIDEEAIEELKEKDVLEEAMGALAESAPGVKRVLIDERDEYLAGKLTGLEGKKILAVIGAGHLKGVKEKLGGNIDLKALENVPKKISKLKLISYAVPVLLATMIIYGIVSKGLGTGLEMFMYWFLINGVLSAIGAAAAGGHPVSIASAFLAAPFTSLNPAIAAGWVAGYVEAKVRKPKVADFEDLNKMGRLRDWWKNRVTRTLLVVIFANLGSSIGTFAALPYLLSLLG